MTAVYTAPGATALPVTAYPGTRYHTPYITKVDDDTILGAWPESNNVGGVWTTWWNVFTAKFNVSGPADVSPQVQVASTPHDFSFSSGVRCGGGRILALHATFEGAGNPLLFIHLFGATTHGDAALLASQTITSLTDTSEEAYQIFPSGIDGLSVMLLGSKTQDLGVFAGDLYLVDTSARTIVITGPHLHGKYNSRGLVDAHYAGPGKLFVANSDQSQYAIAPGSIIEQLFQFQVPGPGDTPYIGYRGQSQAATVGTEIGSLWAFLDHLGNNNFVGGANATQVGFARLDTTVVPYAVDAIYPLPLVESTNSYGSRFANALGQTTYSGYLENNVELIGLDGPGIVYTDPFNRVAMIYNLQPAAAPYDLPAGYVKIQDPTASNNSWVTAVELAGGDVGYASMIFGQPVVGSFLRRRQVPAPGVMRRIQARDRVHFEGH